MRPTHRPKGIIYRSFLTTYPNVRTVFFKVELLKNIYSCCMKNGVIHYYNFKNNLCVVKLDNGSFSVFETNNMKAFKVNDIVYGYLDREGIFEILNGTSQKYYFVVLQKVGLTVDEALERANLM